KAFLEIEGRRIIDRTRDIFTAVFEEVLLVTNAPLEYLDVNVRTVTDLHPGKGALGGVYSGLYLASHPHAFVAACDMPYISESLVRHMVSLAPSFDIVVPRTADGWQPLHAVYSQRCLRFMEELIDQGNLKIIDFFHRVRRKELSEEEIARFDPEMLSFLNLNTPEDLARAPKK
ncbi:MAG TPA: molybdenum cofactor guanylyltransferase, partial [Thermodesulfobacteriota bacterium]|nr:molybdenum cofactor guanylyltransferase [Thermodesulfobacteriota bacterium]